MKNIKGKGKIYKKQGDFKNEIYMNARLREFVDSQTGFIWKDFSDIFGQSAIGTVRNWYIDGIPRNQLFFVHLVLERHKY